MLFLRLTGPSVVRLSTELRTHLAFDTMCVDSVLEWSISQRIMQRSLGVSFLPMTLNSFDR